MRFEYKHIPRKSLSQRDSPCSHYAVILSIIYLVAQDVQLTAGSGLTCSTNATYQACPSALEAAQFLTGSNSLLPITKAFWNATADCNVVGKTPVIKITDFGPCHYWASSMSAGALVLCNGDAVIASKVMNAGKESRQSVSLGIPLSSADPDLQALGQSTYSNTNLFDTVALTFDITPSASGNISFHYVFGSEEYPQFAPGGPQAGNYNDVFAFYIWPNTSSIKTNIAVLPGTSTPVSIGSVNIQKPTYFVANYPTTIAQGGTGLDPKLGTGLNGTTKLMSTSVYTIAAGTTYRIKLVIADMQDGYFDSLVWVKAGSLAFNAPPVVPCVGSWTAWSACSQPCASGSQSRTFNVTQSAANGGTACNVSTGTVQTQVCNANPCPVNCLGNWGAWSTCSKTCGNGTQSRTYIITTAAAYNGTSCSTSNNTVQTQACNTQACPVSCVGSWGAWSACSAVCGGGTQSRMYTVTTAAANNGTDCPAANGAHQMQACNTQGCPVNCIGSWGAWTVCNKTCGGGNQTRTYSVTTLAANGGTNCSASNGTVQAQACNTQACAVDCIGNWGAWSTCSQTCGGGTQSRTYTVSTPAAYGGTNCSAANGAIQTQNCNTQPCPVDCVGSWNAWSTCSLPCGNGSQSSTYTVTTSAANGGAACPAANHSNQTRTCNTQACPAPGASPAPSPSPTPPPVDCVGSYSAWTTCNQTCGGGTQSRTYNITTPAASGGADCPYSHGYVQPRSCNTSPCQVDCVGEWSSWSSCNQTCGGGSQNRTYTITTSAANGGVNCTQSDGYIQARSCNTNLCPVDCVGGWGSWSSCSQTCGGGGRNRTYTITTLPANGGASCPEPDGQEDTQTCNTHLCPVNCVGAWGPWTQCNQTCGGGSQSRSYSTTTAAAYGGANCSEVDGATDTQACNTNPCPVDCAGDWTAWSPCNATCGDGNQTCTYLITTEAAYGGVNCTEQNGTLQTQGCNAGACRDCVGEWSDWSACNQPCGAGIQSQTFLVLQSADPGGTDCLVANGTVATQACNTDPCPIDCAGDWSPWTTCTQPCGGGTQNSTYTVTAAAAYGGATCPAADGDVQTLLCNSNPCSVDCIGDWGPWTSCGQDCGGGTQQRVYNVTSPAEYGGAECPASNEFVQTRVCNASPCSVNCTGDWSAWSGCNASCGGGVQTTTYNVTEVAQYGGAPCPVADGAILSRACNTQSCPAPPSQQTAGPVASPSPPPSQAQRDCVGDYGPWSACSQTCGGGTQSRTYIVTSTAANGGADCPVADGTLQVWACNIDQCPVACVGSWSPWTACTQSCAGGAQNRTYTVTTSAASGGEECPAPNTTVQSRACNVQPCPVNCVDSWSPWSTCSRSCGGGNQTRTYTVTTPAANSGTACSAPNGYLQTQACNTQACPPSCPKPVSGGTCLGPSSPSPSPAHPSPRPSQNTASPSPPPSTTPVPALFNITLLQTLPYYMSPPVLPALAPMEDSNITIHGGNVSIIGVTADAVQAAMGGSKSLASTVTNAGSSILPQQSLKLRWAAFNGSLGFYTLAVDIVVYGEFTLQRTMNWTWSSRVNAWTTQVSVAGNFIMTRLQKADGVVVGIETLSPGVGGLLSLFSAKYPGPGFSGTYDWAGNLDMTPDPFAYWGIHTSESSSASSSRRRSTLSVVDKDPEFTRRSFRDLQAPADTSDGNTPVQGRVSVREVNSQTGGTVTDPDSAEGTQTAIDDEIAAVVPPPDSYWDQFQNKTVGQQIVEAVTQPFKAIAQALSKPENRRFMVVVAAIVAPSGVGVCAASIIGAVLYRKRRRREEQQKQSQLRREKSGAAPDGVIESESGAMDDSVQGANVRNRRSGKRSSALGHLADSESGTAAGNLDGQLGKAGESGQGTASMSHVEFLDPAESRSFASFVGYPKSKGAGIKPPTGPVATETSGDGRIMTLEAAEISDSGGSSQPHHSNLRGIFGSVAGSVAGLRSSLAGMRSSLAGLKGRFGSVTGSIAGIASNVAAAVGHLRSSQAGQAYRVRDLDSVRNSVEAPTNRGPSLPGSTGGSDRRSVDGRGSLHMSAYAGSSGRSIRQPADWGSAGVILNSSGQANLTPHSSNSQARFSPANSNSQTKHTPPTSAERAARTLQAPPRSVPAQWALPNLEVNAKSRNAAWATGVAAAWAADLQIASRGSSPTTPAALVDGNSDDDATDEVVTGGTTYLVPSRSRTFNNKGY